MSKIIVCYKWVLIEEDIKINPDLSVDTSKAKGKISDYDRNAIEAAMQAAGQSGDEVVALTFGNAGAEQSLKDALSRGPQSGCLVKDGAADEADAYATSVALAAAVRRMGDYRLIICSEGASDTYAHQVGPRLGEILDIPVISNACDFSIGGDTLTARRKLEDCLEKVETVLPAVITVLPAVCEAPIPGLKQVLAAGKKPVAKYTAAELGLEVADLKPKSENLGLKGYAMARKNMIFREGDAAEKVARLVDSLKKVGVL